MRYWSSCRARGNVAVQRRRNFGAPPEAGATHFGQLEYSLAICVLILSASAGVSAGDSGLTSVFVTTVEKPVFLTHAPGDFDRLFVVGQDGVISIIKDDLVLEDPFLDITALVDTRSHLRGLLGLAFHPQYQMNGLLYVCYTALPDGDVVLARYEVTADPDIADPETAHSLLSMPHPDLGHHGNWIGFSPIDGLLYFAVGDGAAPFDRDDDAQNLDSLLGKVLRLDVDGDDFPEDPERNYAIPPDNPFVGVDGADEVWIFGFRNPWRCSFDRLSGDLYIGEPISHRQAASIAH